MEGMEKMFISRAFQEFTKRTGDDASSSLKTRHNTIIYSGEPSRPFYLSVFFFKTRRTFTRGQCKLLTNLRTDDGKNGTTEYRKFVSKLNGGKFDRLRT